MASIGDPYTTLKRARKDLANLKASIENLQRGEHAEFVPAYLKESGRIHYDLPNPLRDLSADVGVVAGQLRAVLDQLVHSLFELNKRHPPPAKRRLQFPICQRPEDFRSRIKPDLEGLDPAHIALIEKSQPYNGRAWIAELKLLAEEHKHRKLVYIHATNIQFTGFGSDAEADLLRLPSGTGVPKSVQMKTQITGPICLSDGTPAVEKLEILQAEVANVVDAFKALFD